MRRILTSLPYERRVGIPGAAGKISVRDSIRRALLLPVADTHLDATTERAAGRLVRCDDSGSLLALDKQRVFSEVLALDMVVYVNDVSNLVTMSGSYDYVELYWDPKAFIDLVWVCDAAGNNIQPIPVSTITVVKGARWQYYVKAIGLPGGWLNVWKWQFR